MSLWWYSIQADSPSPQEEYIALVQTGGKSDPPTIEALFQALPPIKPAQLLGDWNHGGFFDTGHPVGGQLVEIKWIGKSFKSVEDVDPVIIDQDGKRTSWGEWGFACVGIVQSSQKQPVLNETLVARDGI